MSDAASTETLTNETPPEETPGDGAAEGTNEGNGARLGGVAMPQVPMGGKLTSDFLSPEGPREVLSDLCHLVTDRAAVEKRVQTDFAERNAEAEQAYRESQDSLTKNYREKKAAIEKEYNSMRDATETKFRTEHDSTTKEYEAARAKIEADYAGHLKDAEQALRDARGEATEAADAARGVNLPVNDVLAGIETRWQQLDAIHQQAVDLLKKRGHWEEVPAMQPVQVVLEKHPSRRFCRALEMAQSQSRELGEKQIVPELFRGVRSLGLFAIVFVVVGGPAGSAMGWDNLLWLAIAGVPAAIAATVAGVWANIVYKRHSIAKYLVLRNTMLEAGMTTTAALETAKVDAQKLDSTINARYKSQIQAAEEEYAGAKGRIERRHQKELAKADSEFPRRLEQLTAWREQTFQKIEAKYPPLLKRLDNRYAEELQRIRERYEQAIAENKQQFDAEWGKMADLWRTGYERFSTSVVKSGEESHELFPSWTTEDWDRWKPPLMSPPAITFARSQIKLSDVPNGVPDEEQLRPGQTDFTLPITLPFPARSLLLVRAAGPARGRAIDLLQSAMLRMLTSMPPSKVRFTIIDPVGLGDNFSAFMNLADFDEQLVASRIWTDSVHIEQRLADLTKHMENVIQVYLRQEYQSIDEYNASAGELAEPYRVLVVANYPASFTEAAVNRIKSIVESGAQCGVFVMMSIDTKAPVPRNCQLPDLDSKGLALRWDDGSFVWKHPEFGPLSIEFDDPPSVERFKDIVRSVGSAAKDFGRVEVPFPCIAPDEKDWWTSDSRAGIDVPLGRAGAMKLQHLDLGHGTSQHVLISGKTGSGKSTLLHVLITNMALRYSPDEVELYLVDFKKGVEFKAYARAMMPHARVVAIESEREFGLSVLQRLDSELRTRGDMFRKLGTQDVKAFRAHEPDARLPRILLIVDEFQELFVEDDKIAAESALLLDRLVRQGRAFGIHVLLGSQTLGGAYTLARSTIGQMAVRIALQCSEADAHLILSEDNTAARLLTRPGEAIYNDANGLYEGNHPFQIVWLSDSDRDEYLRKINEMAQTRHILAPPPIVFEGNVLADLGDNPILHESLESPNWPEPSPWVHTWLGSAVAIKDPTSAVLQRQNGSNILIVGHREESALGLLSSCFISLAAQHPPAAASAAPAEGESSAPLPVEKAEEPKPDDEMGFAASLESAGSDDAAAPSAVAAGPRFYILDGMRSDAPEYGFWNKMIDLVPQTVKVADLRDASDMIGEIAKELRARQQGSHESLAPIYLLMYNLGRFRELRKEDDFGFSSSSDEEPTTPSKQFSVILREGPPLGIHTVVWCDTYANCARMFDRQNMQDFEMRILFQMNGNDSASLMDSPEASRLGVHRAILYDEGQGLLEKFRPYGLPSDSFLAFVKKQLWGRK
jgi:DNA segregation ATPase FtsK/SpoIIIE, S-DNA-T family